MKRAQANYLQSRPSPERVLCRQRELLHEEQKYRSLKDCHQTNQVQTFDSSYARHQRQCATSDYIQQNCLNVTPPLGLDKSSSRQHTYVIQAALNALHPSNDLAYLTMLNKAEASSFDVPAVSSSGIQSRIHKQMQFQMQEYNH